MYSRWPIREDTDALIATDGPGDTRDPAFVIRRVPSGTSAGTDVIMFGAGCTDRVRAFVDHVPARGGRWRNVTGPDAKYTECTPPVDELEASFVGYVNGTSRLATAPRAACHALPRIASRPRCTAGSLEARAVAGSAPSWFKSTTEVRLSPATSPPSSRWPRRRRRCIVSRREAYSGRDRSQRRLGDLCDYRRDVQADRAGGAALTFPRKGDT